MRKILLPLLFFLASSAGAAISTTTIPSPGFGTDSSPITVSVTIPPGTDRFLGVYAGDYISAGMSVVYGATPLTPGGCDTGVNQICFFYMVNPPVGTANVVATTFNNSGGFVFPVGWSGVDQTIPIGTPVSGGAGFGSPTTYTLTTPVDSVVWDGMINGVGVDPGTGQIRIGSGLLGLGDSFIKLRTGATTDMTYSDDAPTYFAVPLLPASATPAATPHGDVVGQGESDSGGTSN